jgi:proton glutamate symport protein
MIILAARLLLAGVFVVAGWAKLADAAGTRRSMADFGVPQQVLGIVAPLSLSFNLCGSCIHLAMCTLFVAQAAGISMTFTQQAIILLTLKFTSKGVVGIPRANFVILSGLFATFGLPASGLTMLLGVDALIDMVRTSVNVVGHCVACPVIACWAAQGATQEKLSAELVSPEPL